MRNVSYITCAEDMRGPIETVIRSGVVHRLIQFLLDESFPKLQSVIDANLIPTLVKLAQNAEFDMKKESVCAISNATLLGSHDQIKYMVEQSCIKPLCDILFCPDVKTILKCLDGMENTLKVGDAEKNAGDDVSWYTRLIEAEGLDKILNLQRHENIEIYDKALKILQTYWLEEDDEDIQQPPS
ncbi:putative armadillo-like helical protein [Arabidopsis thaliana]